MPVPFTEYVCCRNILQMCHLNIASLGFIFNNWRTLVMICTVWIVVVVVVVRCAPTFALQSPFPSDRGCDFVMSSRSLRWSSSSLVRLSLPVSLAALVMLVAATKKHHLLSTLLWRLLVPLLSPPTPARHVTTHWWRPTCYTHHVMSQLDMWHVSSLTCHMSVARHLTWHMSIAWHVAWLQLDMSHVYS